MNKLGKMTGGERLNTLSKCICSLLIVCIIFLSVKAYKALGKDGWINDNGIWSHYTAGEKDRSWISEGIDKWYYLNSEGIMQTGLVSIDNESYYFITEKDKEEYKNIVPMGNENSFLLGQMYYGWKKLGENWYFFSTEHDGHFGKAIKGYQWVDSCLYFFDENGVMFHSGKIGEYTAKEDGALYKAGVKQHRVNFGYKSKHVHTDEKGVGERGDYSVDSEKSGGGSSSDKGKDESTDNEDKEDKILKCEVRYHMNFGEDGADDIYKTEYYEVGERITSGVFPEKEGYFFRGWSNDNTKDCINADYHDHFEIITKDIDLYAQWVDMTKDSDEDGLSDDIEEILETDKYKKDTDGDGLSDYDEVFNFREISPIKYDSDGNGISDFDEDEDGDGLNNGKELLHGTEPRIADSDKDGLSDGQEIKKGTNPLNTDTDGDRLSDSEEEYGFSPLLYDTDGNGICDSDEIISVEIKCDEEEESNINVIVKTTLENAKTIQIEKDFEDNPYIYEGVPGYQYEPYNLTAENEIDEAELTFKYSEDKEVNEEYKPVIYYVDTENQILEELENQNIDEEKHTVTATTTHFSRYALLNKVEQEKAWSEEILSSGVKDYTYDARLEVVFVIDNSGSMQYNDPEKKRIELTKGFIDKLRSEDKAGAVGFNSRVEAVYSELTEDFESIKESIDEKSTNGYGGTNISAGIEWALTQFPQAEEGTDDNIEVALKIIILLTDGDGGYSHAYTQTAIERGVKIYTIGLGNDVNTALLNKIAEDTGAKYNHANSSEELEEAFDRVITETVAFTNDTDEDKISDYHEDRIRLFNGQKITIDKDCSDTDNDGLKDGEEIVQTVDRYGRMYFKMYTNPSKKDTDGDGLFDGISCKVGSIEIAPKDPKPLEYTGSKGLWKGHIEQMRKAINKTSSDTGIPISKEYDKDDCVLADYVDVEGVSENSKEQLLEILDEIDERETDLKQTCCEIIKSEIDAMNMPWLERILTDSYIDSCVNESVKQFEDFIEYLKTNVEDFGPDTLVQNFVFNKEIDKFVYEMYEYKRTIKDDHITKDVKYHFNIFKSIFGGESLYVEFDDGERMNLKEYIICVGIMLYGQELIDDEIFAANGAYVLNMRKDEDGVARHAIVDTWQRLFGYNDFYDWIFYLGANIDILRFYFTVNGEKSSDKYVLWAWKGDYTNLNTGGEVGLYKKNNGIRVNGYLTGHYDCVDYELPMSLDLYNYYSPSDMKPVFFWHPKEDQWWITGFKSDFNSPNPSDPDPENIAMIAGVDFSGHKELFDAMVKAQRTHILDKEKDDYIEYENYIILDQKSNKAWIMWQGLREKQ